jgi:hypothetical protein
VNEAVELAKEFSTDKSPAFVNGLLDKVLKQVLAARGESAEATVAEGEGHGTDDPTPHAPVVRTKPISDVSTPPPPPHAS